MGRLIELPSDLPVPIDDGAASHLRGMRLPHVELISTRDQRIDLADLGLGRTVLYAYPRTGRPDRPVPADWDAISRGARMHSGIMRIPRPLHGAESSWG